jgi:hypothetical protein
MRIVGCLILLAILGALTALLVFDPAEETTTRTVTVTEVSTQTEVSTETVVEEFPVTETVTETKTETVFVPKSLPETR